jgi:hypothetical protein
MKNPIRTLVCFVVVAANLTLLARADEVTQWNQHMLDALITGNVGGVVATRHAAIVQSAVYDAVNGIERRYTHIHVAPAAPPGASVRAAAIQAAYETLAKLFPAQKSDLDAKLAASLGAIASDEAVEHSQSIARGIEWGKTVADEIWAWRSADGFSPAPPANNGATGVGQWRPTPPAFLPFAAVQLGSTTPWIIASATQFPLPGPPALNSAEYTADFNEVKQLGSLTSITRTDTETAIANFWASANSPVYFWDRLALRLIEERHTTLSENARLLAMVNVAIADAGIAIWNAKLSYLFWRPMTAIRLADTDGNISTIQDAGWVPLLVNPPYPDYPSGLVGTSAAGAGILENFFGADTSFILESNAMPGVVRFYGDFDTALDEVVNARISAGIHFRFADEDARWLGAEIANYVMGNAFLPLAGKHKGQTGNQD